MLVAGISSLTCLLMMVFGCSLINAAVLQDTPDKTSQDAELRPELKKVVETERAFAAKAARSNVRAAFLEYLDEHAVVFQPGPTNGHEVWQARPVTKALLAWSPVWADASASGEFGYTTGDWTFHPEGAGSAPAGFGQYITVWKRREDGTYRAQLDIGVQHPRPEQVSTTCQAAAEAKNPPRLDDDITFPFGEHLSADDYKKFVTDDVRLYRAGQLPIIGSKNAWALIEREREHVTQGEAQTTRCEGTADFKYCYGTLKLTLADGKVRSGNLVRIWRRRDGNWRLELEVFDAAK